MSKYRSIIVFGLVFISIMAISVGLTMGMDKLASTIIVADIVSKNNQENEVTPIISSTPIVPTESSGPEDKLEDLKEILESTSTPSPSPIKTKSPSPSPTSSPSPTPTPVPTPKPTPTPIPDPALCSLDLTYKVDFIHTIFFEKEFTRDEINSYVSEAEKKIEDALGRDIFKKDSSSKNTINFVNDPLSSNENGYGKLVIEKAYKNGAIESFNSYIYSALFTYAGSSDNSYMGPSASADKLREYLLKKNILKQFGHMLGSPSLNQSSASAKDSIMIGKGWVMTSYEPKLTSDDINHLKKFCGI